MDGKNLRFKGWLAENNIKQKDIAELLEIDISNVNEKINGKQEFTVAQIRTICQTYGISADIFL
jgi:predicted XRE-type DNA-binding protein